MTKKKTTTEETAVKKYTVLIACGNSATGKEYKPGDTVTNADFPQKAIDNWLAKVPPVLMEAD